MMDRLKREELSKLEEELREEREKYRQIELDFQKQLADLREKNKQDLG